MVTPEPRPRPTQHGPVRPQLAVRSAEHRPQRVVVQRLVDPATPIDRPPDLVARADGAADVGQVEAQPYERFWARWQPLLGLGSFADHPDQLLAPVDIRTLHAEQLGGAGTGAHPHRQDRPVPVTAQRREQRIPLLVRHRPRLPLRQARVVTQPPVRLEDLQRVVMRVRPASTRPIEHYWVHQRPFTTLQPELVESPQHGIAMPHRRRLVAVPEITLPSDRIDQARSRPRLDPLRCYRLGRLPEPQHEIPDLRRGRLIPGHADRDQEPPPPQQRQRIAAHRVRRPSPRDEVPQECLRRQDRRSEAVDQHPRHHTIGGSHASPYRKPDRLNRAMIFVLKHYASSMIREDAE